MLDRLIKEKVKESYLDFLKRFGIYNKNALIVTDKIDNLLKRYFPEQLILMIKEEFAPSSLSKPLDMVFPLKCRLSNFPLKSQCYDTIIFYSSELILQSIDNKEFQELKRILKEDGRLVFLYSREESKKIELWKLSSNIRTFFPYITVIAVMPWWGCFLVPLNLRRKVLTLNIEEFLFESLIYIFICGKRYFSFDKSWYYLINFEELVSVLKDAEQQFLHDYKLVKNKIDKLEKEKEILQKEIEHLNERIIEREKIIDEKERSLLELQAQLQRYKREERVLELKEELIKEHEITIRRLDEEKENLRLELEEKRRVLKVMEDNLKRVSTKFLQLEQLYYEQQEKLAENKIVLAQKEKEVDLLKERLALLEEECDKSKELKEEIVKLRTALLEKDNVIEEIERKLEKIRDERSKIENKIEKYKEKILNDKYKEFGYKFRIRELKEIITTVSSKLEEKEREIERISSQLSDASHEIKHLSEIIREKESLLLDVRKKIEEKEKNLQMVLDQFSRKEKEYKAQIELLQLKIEQQAGKIWYLEEEATRNKARLLASLKQAEIKEKEFNKKIEELSQMVDEKNRILKDWKEGLVTIENELKEMGTFFEKFIKLLELYNGFIKNKL